MTRQTFRTSCVEIDLGQPDDLHQLLETRAVATVMSASREKRTWLGRLNVLRDCRLDVLISQSARFLVSHVDIRSAMARLTCRRPLPNVR